MQAQLLKVSKDLSHSFVARTDKLPYLYDRWHYHPEIELTFIEQGLGTRFVGDSIEEFNSGDLILLGSNLPHVWRSDSSFYQGNPEKFVIAHVIQFVPEVLNDSFSKLPEMQSVFKLLEQAQMGIKIEGDFKYIVKEKILEMRTLTGARRISLLIDILEMIFHHENKQTLSSTNFMQNYHGYDTEKINKVYEYVLSNFREEITLKKMADLANLSETHFCRFFKSRTRKSLIEFVNEVRISHACRLLIEQEKSVNEIAFESGYNNIANFNRQFKQIKNITPLSFKKLYQS
jgi:AraC-like DNA-binding protein